MSDSLLVKLTEPPLRLGCVPANNLFYGVVRIKSVVA